MIKSTSKISGCVLCKCFVLISPLLCVVLLICVTQTSSSFSNISTIMYDNTKQPSDINSSYQENPIMDETSHAFHMNGSDLGYNSSINQDLSHPLSTSKEPISWSEELWNQLKYNMKNSKTNFINMSDFDMFRVPFYYNYEDYFPNLNDSAIDEFDLFDELNGYDGLNDIHHLPETNNNLTDSISSIHSLLSILTNTSGTGNTSISLSDIILSHHLNSIISQQSNKTNYIESPVHLNEPDQLYLPPWENLTTIQKDVILKSALGEPQKYSNVTVLSLAAYYGAILSVGIPGNALTLLIIITNSYMRTAPNIFLLNVALADLLTLTLGKYILYRNQIILMPI